MTYDDSATDIYIDPRGHLVERIDMAGQEVHLHYRDIPESDITTVHGLRVTTPLRTVIDAASDGDAENLALMVGNCLGRGRVRALRQAGRPKGRRGAQISD